MLTAALKLLGLGGAGSAGAASAGGGAAAGGGAIAIAGGGGTAAKVAAVVCCAALTAGGAAEMTSLVTPSSSSSSAGPKHAGAPASAGAQQRTILPVITPAVRTPRVRIGAPVPADAARSAAHGSPREVTAGRTVDGPTASSVTESAGATDALTGGVTAPNEESGFGHGVDGLTPIEPSKPSQQVSSKPSQQVGSSAAPPSAATSPVSPAGALSPSSAGTPGSSTGSAHGTGSAGTAGGAHGPAPGS
jgi:hypothetical protein